MRALRFPWLVVTVGIAACGSSEEPGRSAGVSLADEPRAVRTLKAAIVAEPGSPVRGNLRVAILWDVNVDGHHSKWIRADDIGIAKTWPVRFTMDLSPTPPVDAIRNFVLGDKRDPSTVVLREARAKIVVYEDRSGNERFDPIPAGSEERIDVIVGADDDLFLEWVDGTDEGWARNLYTPGLGLARGMNLVKRPDWGILGPQCVEKPCETPSGVAAHALPPDREVVLSTTVSLRSESIACERFEAPDSSGGGIDDPCPSPLPSGRGTICLRDDRSVYISVGFPTPLPVCDLRHRLDYCGVHRDPALPAPANWPCP